MVESPQRCGFFLGMILAPPKLLPVDRGTCHRSPPPRPIGTIPTSPTSCNCQWGCPKVKQHQFSRNGWCL